MGAPDNTELGVRGEFERVFGPGEIVFDEGDLGDSLFVIQSGEIELLRTSASALRALDRIGPGEFFGEMSVVLGGTRSVRARAVIETRVLELDGSTLQEMCLARPEIALRLLRRLAARVIELEKQLFALGADELLRRVVGVLLERAEATAEGARIPVTLREIGLAAGVALPDAHAALQKLFERKLIRLSDDVLFTTDADALTRLSTGSA